MISNGAPGLRVPRKRVEIDHVMWQENSGIAGWNATSMCKATGSRDYETSAIAQSSVERVSNPVLSTRAELNCKSDERIRTVKDGDPRMKHEVAMLATIPHEKEGDDEQYMEGVVIEVDSESLGNLPSGAADDEFDMGFDEFQELLLSEDPPEVMTQPVIDDELRQTTVISQEVSTSYPQQMDDDIFLHQSFPTQDLLQSGIGLSSGHASGQDYILASHPYQASRSGTFSDHQNFTSNFDVNLNEVSWHSASSVTYEGGAAGESDFGSSPLPSFYDDAVEQLSEGVDFGDTLRSSEQALSIQPFYSVDCDRPSQTDGSVLASEVKFKGTINALHSTGTAVPPSTHSVLHNKKFASRSDVVDLTGDSDEDTIEHVAHPGRLGLHVKRKTQDHGEVYNKKRLNSMGGSSYHSGIDIYDDKTGVSRSKILTIEQINNFQKFQNTLAEDSKSKAGTLISNHVPQRWNIAGTSHFPSRDGPGSFIEHSVHLVGGRSVQFSKGGADIIAGRENSMPARTSYDLKVKRNPAVVPSVEASASLSCFTKMPTDGSSAEEATLEEGLLSVSLLKHQKVALAWMMTRELEGAPAGGILADDQGLGKTISTISLILKARPPIQLPNIVTVDLVDDDEDTEVAGQTQAVSLPVTVKKESSLPLTLNTVGKGPGLQKMQEQCKVASNKRRPVAGTLVVCPTSVLRQWAHELKEKVTELAGLSVLIYHGSNRTKDPEEVAKYDVVLTTYSIVSMEVPKQPLPEEKSDEKKRSGDGENDFPPPFRGASKAKKPKKATENGKKSKGNGKGRLIEGENGSVDSGPLARVNWFRVVLDEAQSIKNARTQVARAAWGLRAKRRWCLSGTPLQNAVDDLYSYFRFLRYYPFDSYSMFREKIKDPVTRFPSEGYRNVQKLLAPVMIRRTKATKIGGQPIVNLPQRIVILKQAEFSQEERAFYDNLENESRKEFQGYAAAGTVQSNYVNILWMLLRLRQACDHPLLVKGRKDQGAQKVVLDSAKKLPIEKRTHLLSLLEANRDICSICNDLPDEAVVCICTHIFCRQCISEQLATGDDTCCPIPKCRKSLNTSLVFTAASLKNSELGEGSSSGKSFLLERPLHEEGKSTEDIDWKSSSKIDAVIDTLSALPPIRVVLENGRVVVEKFTNLESVDLLDTESDIRTAKQEPLFVTNLEPDSIVKCEPLSGGQGNNDTNPDVKTQASTVKVERFEPDAVVKGEPFSVGQGEPLSVDNKNITDLKIHASTFKVGRVHPGQADLASNTKSLKQEAAVVKDVKQEAGLSDIVSIQEPPNRQILESTEKAIVFSQWTQMLDLLEVKLKEAKFNYRRLDGTMSVLARDRAVSDFRTQPEVTVIIMSLKAASLGLNMVAACHVLLLDVWWNPTTEDQAIDRAHRIGQTRTVKVSRFTVKNTIEDRILALQEKKRLMVASAFAGKDLGIMKNGLSAQDLQFLFDG